MQALDYDPDIHLKSSQPEADKTLLVKFEIRPRQDKAKSLEAGRPIFTDTVYVDIRAPGDRLGGVCRPASQRDVDRFPAHYAAFLNRTKTDVVEGTPLTEWPLITRSQVEELAFAHVKTVEQLANVADVHGDSMMGFQTLRKKARDWLEVSNENAAALKLKEELKARDDEIELLKKQMDELAVQVEARKTVNQPQEAKPNDEVAELRKMVEALVQGNAKSTVEAEAPAPKVTKKAKRKPGRPKVVKPAPE